MREMGERHWDAWLDMRLPALGNSTPRQAARSAAGRERLDALFTEFERVTERSPNAMSPDVHALRAKLGLPAQWRLDTAGVPCQDLGAPLNA